MPAYLFDPLTGEALSPVFLRISDAEAALAGSEIPRVSTFLANVATFPPRRGFGWPARTVDVYTREWVAMTLGRYERQFLEACRTG